MAVTVTPALLSAANAAAAGAAEGSKRNAFGTAIAAGIGSGYKLVARRNGGVVLDLTMSGSLVLTAAGLVIPNDYSTLNALLAAQINSGTWTLRIEKASDAAVYLQGTLGPPGSNQDFTLSQNLDPDLGIALSGITLRLPMLDGSLALDFLASDVNTSLAHEYLMDGVNPSWSWGTYPRAGVGANPPNASGWNSPAWIAWGHAGTQRNNPPGSHNWRLAIHSVHTHEKRGGSWQTVHAAVTSTAQHSGAMYLNYETNESTPADRRTSNGFVEVKFPNNGGAYHFYPSFRTSVPPSGAQHLVVLIEASITKDNPSGADDRAGARVAALAGGDYWKSMGQGWDPNSYSNDDFWIGRARKPALWPERSWHAAHTMTSDADINEYRAFVATLGIL